MSKQGPATKEQIAATLGKGDGKATAMRSSRMLAWLIIIGVIAAGVLTWLRPPAESSALEFTTEPVTRGNLTETVSATGTLQPTNTVDVGIEVSGTVSSVEADFNDRVTVGQVLARLDPSKLNAQVQQSTAALESAKAMVLQAKASVREAQLELERLLKFRQTDPGLVSQQSLDTAQAAYDGAVANAASASAKVQQTLATLEAHRTDLSKAVIRSPINGVVLNRSVEPGQTVVAAFQSPVLFRLAEDLKRMELQANIDEADIGKVREGQTATFTVDAYPNREFPAKIKLLRFGSQMAEAVVSYKAILSVDNTDLILRPGMTATAQIVVEQLKDVLLVPNAALRFVPPAQTEEKPQGALLGRMLPSPTKALESAPVPDYSKQDHVWILRDGAPVAVPVTAGATDGKFTAVTSDALKPGALVITDLAGKK